MARTIAQIKKEQTDRFIAFPTIISLYDLKPNKSFDDQFSSVSIESILFYVVASTVWTLETLFDLLKKEVYGLIDLLKPHSVRWYANAAKLFQYGDNLMNDSDKYDNSGKTAEQIQASKIVAYSAVIDLEKDGLIVKVAKDAGNDLAPLTDVEMSAFSEYMNRVKDAGIRLEIISAEADKLKLRLKVHYNPLVLNSEGQRLDGASITPVADAIRTYLKNLPFNGILALAYLTDALQEVEGIVIPTIESAQYSYGDLSWSEIGIINQPYSGYMRIDDADLDITYVAQSEIL